MSQSPDEVLAGTTVDETNGEFLESVRRLNRMLDQGLSWSGNERNCCFLNTGSQRFANISSVTTWDYSDDGRGMALVDWDHDGDLDIWTSNRTAPRVRFLRNDMPVGHHFLMLRLRGTKCNRDAVGARVEVILRNDDRARRIRTLRAGEGFLSQSSKWIHFGLGARDDIQQIVVRWPGGDVEQFANLSVDQHYVLVQGSGEAEPGLPRDQVVELISSPPDLPAASHPVRTALTSPLPLPPLSFRTFDGVDARLQDYRGGPLLINLWASWCGPCLTELSELTRNESALRGANIRIVAVSVDEIDVRTGNLSAAKDLIKRVGFPFVAATATESLAGKLQLIANHVYGPNRPLSVPTSFLIDGSGRLATIYKGPVTVQSLLDDVSTLATTDDRAWQAALPYEGRWLGRPSDLKIMPLVIDLVNHDFDDEGAAYLAANRDRLENHPRLPIVQTHLGRKYLQQGDLTTAEFQFRQALSSNGTNHEARMLLADLLKRRGNDAGAIKEYQSLIEVDADYAPAHLELGRHFLQQGAEPKAATHFLAYLRTGSNHADVQMNLGVIYARRGQWERAADHLNEALRLRPKHYQTHNNLGLVLEQLGSDSLAAEQFRLAIETEPGAVNAALNLSSLLATSDESSVRNPAEAVALAERCARQTQYGQIDVLDVLATSYAAAGRRDEAIQTAETALKQARSEEHQSWIQHIEKRLQQYRRQRPVDR